MPPARKQPVEITAEDLVPDLRAGANLVERGGLRVVANLADSEQLIPLDLPAGEILIASAPVSSVAKVGITLPRESVGILRVLEAEQA